MSDNSLPDELAATMRKTIRLKYSNLFWTATIIVAVGMVLVQSQTIKTAWV